MVYHKPLQPWQRMEDLASVVNLRVSKHDWNKLMAWNGNETIEHFVTKALLFKAVRDNGRIAIGEASIADGFCDVLDLSTGRIYEVEQEEDEKKEKAKVNKYSTQYIEDIYFIHLTDMPDELKKGLQDWFKKISKKVI